MLGFDPRRKRFRRSLCCIRAIVVGGLVLVACNSLVNIANSPSEVGLASCDEEAFTVVGDGLRLKWTTAVDHGVGSPLVLTDSRVALIDREVNSPMLPPPLSQPEVEDRVVVMDAATGRIQWSAGKAIGVERLEQLTASETWTAAYAWFDDSQDRRVLVYESESGELAKEIDIRSLDMAVGNHHLYLRDIDRVTKVLSLPEGIQVFSSQPEVIDSGNQFVLRDGMAYSVYGASLVVFQDLSGSVILEDTFHWQGRESMPIDFAVHKEYVAVLVDGGLALYSISNGLQLKWESTEVALDGERWPPAFTSNQLFVFDKDNTLIQIDLESGTALKELIAPKSVHPVAGPVAVGQDIMSVFSDGTVRRTFAENMQEWSLMARSSSLRYPGNHGYHHYFTSITPVDDNLFLSFGCSQVYALTGL